MNIKNYVLFVFLSFIFLGGCTSYEGPDPIGPNGSKWLGGPDGGAYVLIKDDNIQSDEWYYAEIYYDHNKEVWYKGRVKYQGKNNFDPSLFDQYSDWDGEKLHLKNGGYLASIEPLK